MECPVCHTEQEKGARFCANCGAALRVPKKQKQGKYLRKNGGKRHKRLWIAVLCVVALLVAVGAGILGWYFRPSQQILRYVQSGDRAAAQQIYRKNQTNANAIRDISATLKEEIWRVEEKFSAGEMAYSVAKLQLETIDALKLTSLRDEVEQAYEKLEMLNASQIAYSLGQEALQRQDYPEAIMQFSQVISEDRCYEEAQELVTQSVETYKKSVLEDAAENVANQNYQSAIWSLEISMSVLGSDPDIVAQRSAYIQMMETEEWNAIVSEAEEYASKEAWKSAITVLKSAPESFQDNPQWASLMEEYEKKQEEKVTSEALEAAQRSMDAQEYANALSAIRDAQKAYPDHVGLKVAYETCCEAYLSWVNESAMNAFNNEGYEAAIRVIQEAQRSLPGDKQLAEWKSLYESYRPVPLSSLDYLREGGDGLTYRDNGIVDNYGNTYTAGFSSRTSSPLASGLAWREYYIDESYSYLKATFILSDLYKSTQHNYYCRIYGDDVLLLDVTITGGEKPKEIYVGISDVDVIKIEMHASSSDWLGTTTYAAYLVNAVLEK